MKPSLRVMTLVNKRWYFVRFANTQKELGINSSKECILLVYYYTIIMTYYTIIMTATSSVAGKFLPCYVVYRSEYLSSTEKIHPSKNLLWKNMKRIDVYTLEDYLSVFFFSFILLYYLQSRYLIMFNISIDFEKIYIFVSLKKFFYEMCSHF